MIKIFNLLDSIVVQCQLREVCQALQVGYGANTLERYCQTLDLGQAHGSPKLGRRCLAIISLLERGTRAFCSQATKVRQLMVQHNSACLDAVPYQGFGNDARTLGRRGSHQVGSKTWHIFLL